MSLDTPVVGGFKKAGHVSLRLLFEALFLLPIACVVVYVRQADLVDRAFFVTYASAAIGIKLWRPRIFANRSWLVLHGAICYALLGQLDKMDGYNSDMALDFAQAVAACVLMAASFGVMVRSSRHPHGWLAGILAVCVLVGPLVSAPIQMARQFWFQSMDAARPCVYATKITKDTVYGVSFSDKYDVMWFGRETVSEPEGNHINVQGLGGGSMSARLPNISSQAQAVSKLLFCEG